MLDDVIAFWDGEEVSALEVYSDIFKFGEGCIQVDKNEKPGSYKANPLAYWRNWKDKRGHYRVMFEQDWERLLPELQAADFCIVNGLSYFGRRNVQARASKMYAMIFDLDGVTDKTLNAFFSGAVIGDAYPLPNYISLSGHGVHLYYVFERPVSLYPNIKVQLRELKYALTDLMWNKYTSINDTVQRQGINQGFRVIGGKTKEGAPIDRVRAFRVNTHPFSLNQLAYYVSENVRFDEEKLFKESKMTKEEAKQLYPEWYERVVVNDGSYPPRWHIEEKVNGKNPYALYDWWKRQIRQGAAYTHRYFCIMCLAIYGVKCNVPYEQVKKDAYDFIPFLNAINPDAPFTSEDVEKALEAYQSKYYTFPIKDIMALSDIRIEKNKRNKRSQKDHMAIITRTRDYLYPDGSWRNKNGRPKGSGTKEVLVTEYAEAHPEASVAEIAKALGVSRSTVYKYANPNVPIPKNQESVGESHESGVFGLGKTGAFNIELLFEKDHDEARAKRLRSYFEKTKAMGGDFNIMDDDYMEFIKKLRK